MLAFPFKTQNCAVGAQQVLPAAYLVGTGCRCEYDNCAYKVHSYTKDR